MKDGELDAADALVAQLQDALAPLETLRRAAAARLPRSRKSIATRSTRCSMPGSIDPDGAEARELDEIFETILQGGRIAIRPGDYAEMFQAALADGRHGAPARAGRAGAHLRPLEARLQNVDLMVLGGLTEGVWPPETRADPWLSRPMRQALGLDLPERRIGLSAHDFVQALGAQEVVLTRAARVAGAPTVASRFVQRLAAVAGEARWSAAIERGSAVSRLRARGLTGPHGCPQPVERPAPAPPLRRAAQSAVGHRDRDAAARSRIRSTPGTCSACARSTRSTRRSARATAAP